MQLPTFKEMEASHLNEPGFVVKHDLALVRSNIHVVGRRGHADVEKINWVLVHVVLPVGCVTRCERVLTRCDGGVTECDEVWRRFNEV